MNELFSGDHGGHDAAHTLRVYINALMIAKTEPDCDMSVVSLGALLHDADDHKLFKTADNANARGFLSQNGVPEETADRICAVINAVSFSKNRGRRPETPEGRIVQDADRLDAIGAAGIARTFAYGGEHGRSLEASVRHFYDKLLLLKDEMNTETGKQLAGERHRFLEEFLEHWHDETGCRGE
ncbi:MAG: HD domain-containing protein [Clostridia bacterium]|nr:HD domain-containing protein [Clostridia bacterium]